MPRPRKGVDLHDLLDSPIDFPNFHQKRINRLQRNDVDRLASDMDVSGQPMARNSNRNGAQRALAATEHHAHHPNQRNRSKNTNKPKSHKKPVEPLKPLNSAEHTNVTCRFVVRTDAQLTASAIEVDKPLSSKHIWRIFSPFRECPICLEHAEVPRMLGCGHVMCFHCMLKHRKYSSTPDTCPICGEAVSLQPTRALPVTFLESDPQLVPKIDEEVVLTLMSRPVDSTVALPVNLGMQNLQRSNNLPDPELILWTRLTQGNVEYAKRELAGEVKYLVAASKRCIAESGYDEEGYDEAAADLKRHIHNMNLAEGNNLEHPQTNKTKPPRTSEEFVYFYQTSFESPVIYTLSNLDVSILRSAYGSFDKFPTSLIAKVVNIEMTILDRTNDKRLRYFSHIPEQTQIGFLECDWTGVLDNEVLAKFKTKLDERHRHLRDKRAKEYAEDQRAHEAIENQFQVEVAEAMLPHDNLLSVPSGVVDLDTDLLPKLKKTSISTENAERAEESLRRKQLEEQQQYEQLMKNAYVTKKGRKNLILRF